MVGVNASIGVYAAACGQEGADFAAVEHDEGDELEREGCGCWQEDADCLRGLIEGGQREERSTCARAARAWLDAGELGTIVERAGSFFHSCLRVIRGGRHNSPHLASKPEGSRAV